MLSVRCAYVNKTEGYQIDRENQFQEAWTDHRGDLFRSLRREYGRCVSKMYVDGADGSTRECGYVFEGRDRYQDTGKPYTRETWVEIREDATA